MKTTIYFALIFLTLSIACKGQTPEQQKMIDDMEKKGMEAQRQYDSIMNTAQVKKIMQETEAMEAQAKLDRDKRNSGKEKNSQKPNNPKSDLGGYIITGGDAKKFVNWPYGESSIFIICLTSRSTDPGNSKKIGTINADGSFDIQFPEKIATRGKISDSRFIGCGYFGGKGDICLLYTSPSPRDL